MLCTICSQISFKPLAQSGYTWRPDADQTVVQKYAKSLFYFHHCCLPCVFKESQNGCTLCAFFLSRIKVQINISYDDGLNAALKLPGAGVWVVLTQAPGATVPSADGRAFRSIGQESNWTGTLNFHYKKLSAAIDLKQLMDGLDDIFGLKPQVALIASPWPDLEQDPPGFDKSMALAKSWYQSCTSESGYHNSCKSKASPRQKLPSRVIYVGTRLMPFPRLMETSGDMRSYVTLSYCWGDTQKVKLLTTNLVAFMRAIPTDSLAQTIKDAIQVTRALGFRYLWVDALCILQDSDKDKEKQLPAMGDIYMNSALTIAAAVGDHADAGLFSKGDARMWEPCPIYEEVHESGNSNQIFAVLPSEALHITPLDSRAWIFQEELLATRTLKFCPEGIRWSCVSFCMSQATPGIGFHPSARPEFNLRTWIHEPEWKPAWNDALDPKRRYYEDWYEGVSSYTSRSLTNPIDKLNAMAGLAARMQELRGFTYVQGLWKEDLEYGLLWFVAREREREINIAEHIRGHEYYRMARTSGSGKVSTAQVAGDSLELKTLYDELRPRFMREDLLTQQQSIEVDMALANVILMRMGLVQAIKNPRHQSWSWASLESSVIQFLYGTLSLTAQGTPVARCLRIGCKTSDPSNPYIAARSGHIVLQGALERLVVMPGRIDAAVKEYLASSMLLGRWTANLLYRTGQNSAAVMGFAALDNDPETSNITGKELTVILLRDDTVSPSASERVSPSGFLKPDSKIPFSLKPLADGGYGINTGHRRYVSGLLLEDVSPLDYSMYSHSIKPSTGSSVTVYRRVGLCQMYHALWEEELKDPKKREEVIIVI